MGFSPSPRRWTLCLRSREFIRWAAVLLIACSAPAHALTRFEYSEVAMGVRARIVLYAKDEASAKTAARAAYDRIAALEDVMSDYRPTSELSRLSAKSGGAAVEVSPELAFILGKCQELSRRSDGAFDCTIGPIVKLWRTARKSGQLPSAADLAAAMKLVGWRKLHVSRSPSTVEGAGCPPSNAEGARGRSFGNDAVPCRPHPNPPRSGEGAGSPPSKVEGVRGRSFGNDAASAGPLPNPPRIGEGAGCPPSNAEGVRGRSFGARLDTPGMLLDLGGIAKGYACDEAIRTLKQHGISSALVEMGGDIVVSDAPPGSKGWQDRDRQRARPQDSHPRQLRCLVLRRHRAIRRNRRQALLPHRRSPHRPGPHRPHRRHGHRPQRRSPPTASPPPSASSALPAERPSPTPTPA